MNGDWYNIPFWVRQSPDFLTLADEAVSVRWHYADCIGDNSIVAIG
jgi:hypothetical protein